MTQQLFKLENLVGKMVSDKGTKYHYDKKSVLLTPYDLGVGYEVGDESVLSHLDIRDDDTVYSFQNGSLLFTESDLNFVLGVK
jgi:hypothetical protein